MKKSDSAPMRFILSVTASQAMSLMIGYGQSVNFKRSLSSNKAGIVFSDGMAMTPKTEIEIRRMEKDEKGKSMTMLMNYTVRFLVGDVPRLRTGAVFLAVAGLGIFVPGCNKSQATTATPVPEVEVAMVETRDVPVYGEWVATLDGYVNAEIRPQVSGYIIRQNYKEGSLVRRGQVLFEIDPRPFQATLDRTKGDLAQAQAQLGKATLDVERDTPLAEGKAIAKSQLDNEIQAKLGAQAAVESGKAAVEQAALNLEWTKVTSLVDGIAGIAQVQIGNLVGANSILTSVSQVEPIKAFFPISEHEYLIAQSQANSISSQHTIRFFGTTVELILADGGVYRQKGKVLLADRQVDANTGTIRIVAAFPNPGNILRPGQYGRVRVETNLKKGALLLPQSAVAQSQGSYQVAVVGSDHKVSMRTVKPGETVGTMWVIDEGLKPGEQVAAEGPQKLREGTLVTPQPVHHSGEGN
jgi:RND family efflux transporter MFP subunit